MKLKKRDIMNNLSLKLLGFCDENQHALKIIGLVVAFSFMIISIINLISSAAYIGVAAYYDWYETFYDILLILSAALPGLGFLVLGIALLIRFHRPLIALGLILLLISSISECATNFLYSYIYYGDITKIITTVKHIIDGFSVVLSIIGWLFPIIACFTKNTERFQKTALLYIIIPTILLLFDLLTSFIIGFFSIDTMTLVINIGEYSLMAIIGLLCLCANDKSGISEIAEYGNNGYTGILMLILLSLFTFGIYPLIWIYKISKYTNRYNNQNSIPALAEVCLCTFIPFYYLFWLYNRSKIVRDIFRGYQIPYEDTLMILNPILGFFGLGIVANALLQNEINKLCVGYAAIIKEKEAQRKMPFPNNHIGISQGNFHPYTGQPLNNNISSENNFDPYTGKPLH